MDRQLMLTEAVVVLLAGDLTDEEHSKVLRALEDRGFEVFARRPVDCLDPVWLPDTFSRGGVALVAFNALITGEGLRPSALFPQFEVEKAAHLLANIVPGASRKVRVTRDTAMAGEIITQLLNEQEITDLSATISARRKELATDQPVLKDLSRYKYRAKVELIEWQGDVAVKKTFRPTALDAMTRELHFHDAIAPQSPVPVRILDRTGNAIVFEFVDDMFKGRRLFGSRLFILLDLANTRALADFVRLVLAAGWDPVDLTPGGNLLIDRQSGRLRAIDFEFAHFRGRPLDPAEACFLMGVPDGADFPHPLNNDMIVNPYERLWRRFTGLSLTSFLDDPAWLQRLKRIFIHPFWLIGYIVAEMRRRSGRSGARDRSLASVLWQRSPRQQD